MIAHVLVQLKIDSLDHTFSYLIPPSLEQEVQIGKRVLVPFKNQKLEGFILDITENSSSDINLKSIEKVVDINPVLNSELLELGKYISKKTMCNLISAYQTMLPTALKAKNGISIKPVMVKYTYLINENYLPTNASQQLIIDRLKSGRCLKSDLTKISTSAVNTLIKNKVITVREEEKYRLNSTEKIEDKKNILNDEQLSAVNEVINSINCFQPFLLHGVTGSGKTEVYMNIIDKVLNLGKEVIVLVPEISLTPQLVRTFKGRFQDKIAVLHSSLSDGEKFDEWRKIERKEVRIVVGARSAVFAPFTNIGLIIIDEEHSDTYKQENNPHYDAIDIALKRAKTYKCPVVLGSATPSIESYTRANAGIYKLLTLKNRINKTMPSVELIDMKKELKTGYKVLSHKLIEKINDRLLKGEQVIILLNRRGYSTIVSCSNCGYVMKCPNCDIPLTYHKNGNKMVCHYCNYTTYKPNECSECHHKDIMDMGMGTEKLEEYINSTITGAKTIRMDIDTTQRKGSHEKIINKFQSGEYNILIGTQMIAKGLDFDKVTLVGVIQGDASLALPDFRSAERTFDLLSQVAGRSGRGKQSGEVIIQGFNIDHYSIIAASNHDYQKFYSMEMNLRKSLQYPPYCNLCLIKLSGRDYKEVYNEALKVSNYLYKNTKNITILGPSVANTLKLNNKYYLQIILKYKDTKLLRPSLEFIKKNFNLKTKIILDIDFNPKKI